MRIRLQHIISCLLPVTLLVSCQKDDSAKDYGTPLIYMPQSINVSLGTNANYLVPTSSNALSPEGMNYVSDDDNNKTNVILGASLSGTAGGAYSVDIKVNPDTIQQLLSNGTFNDSYVAMPASVYTIPTRLDVLGNGSGTFYLMVDNGVLTNPAYAGKHLLLAVEIANPSRYDLNKSRATTIVDFSIPDLLPSMLKTPEYNVVAGDQLIITGQNLNKVTEVKFPGTSIAVPVIAQSSSSITIKIPDMGEITRSTLEYTSFVGAQQSSFELVNVDKAYQIFTDGYGENIRALSTALNEWVDYGSTKAISNTIYKRGNASLAITTKDYSPGGLINESGFVNDDYKYITFWARTGKAGWSDGGIAVALMADGMPDGYANDYKGVDLVPRVTENWTYYKIPIGSSSDKPMWSKGNSFEKLGWRMNNYNAPEETIYYDDVLLVK